MIKWYFVIFIFLKSNYLFYICVIIYRGYCFIIYLNNFKLFTNVNVLLVVESDDLLILIYERIMNVFSVEYGRVIVNFIFIFYMFYVKIIFYLFKI